MRGKSGLWNMNGKRNQGALLDHLRSIWGVPWDHFKSVKEAPREHMSSGIGWLQGIVFFFRGKKRKMGAASQTIGK